MDGRNMGEFNYSTFARSKNISNIQQALQLLFESEGYTHLSLETGERAWRDNAIYSIRFDTQERRHVGVVIVPGDGEWMMIKTLPCQILTLASSRLRLPRIGFLSSWLRCDCLQVDLEDGAMLSITEADRYGRVAMSGRSYRESDCDEAYSNSEFISAAPILPRMRHPHFILLTDLNDRFPRTDIGDDALSDVDAALMGEGTVEYDHMSFLRGEILEPPLTTLFFEQKRT